MVDHRLPSRANSGLESTTHFWPPELCIKTLAIKSAVFTGTVERSTMTRGDGDDSAISRAIFSQWHRSGSSGVGAAAVVLERRAHRDEEHVGGGDRLYQVALEEEVDAAHLLEHLLQRRLVKRQERRRPRGDLPAVIVAETVTLTEGRARS